MEEGIQRTRVNLGIIGIPVLILSDQIIFGSSSSYTTTQYIIKYSNSFGCLDV